MRFEKALRRGDGFTLMQVSVSPGAKNFSIGSYNEWRKAIEIRVKSPAREGKANKEIVGELGKLFGTKIEILKGVRGNLKTLKIHATYERVIETLSGLVEMEK